MIGKVNYDVWRLAVGYLVDDLRIEPDFPNTPEVGVWLNTLHCMTVFTTVRIRA